MTDDNRMMIYMNPALTYKLKLNNLAYTEHFIKLFRNKMQIYGAKCQIQGRGDEKLNCIKRNGLSACRIRPRECHYRKLKTPRVTISAVTKPRIEIGSL